MSDGAVDFWRKCSSCKKAIPFSTTYYVCSVSTCTALRTNYVFCSVHCFERHLPGARHKDAAAIEKTSESAAQAASQAASQSVFGPTSRPATQSPSSSAPPSAAVPAKPPQRVFASPSPQRPANAPSIPREVLVIASRLKDYVQARSEYNTSASVMDVLSDHLRVICDRAIDNARAEGRKTVMDRDFEFLKSNR